MTKNSGLTYIESLDAWMLYNKKIKAEIVSNLEFVRKINSGEFKYFEESHEDIFKYDDKIVLINTKKRKNILFDIPPCGLYTLINHRYFGIGITKFNFNSDKYLNLENNIIKKIEDDILKFFNNEKLYNELNIQHKLGILLYGPPGTGKTMFVEYIIKKYFDKTRIIFVPIDFRIEDLYKLRYSLSDKHTIFIFEEITTNLTRSSYLFSFLNFLDGVYSWDKVLIIATTNYANKIPGNIIDRPSRFDKIYKIDFPNKNIRKKYFKEMMGNDWITEEILNKTKGMSIAYLKELCISCKINNYKPIEVINEFEQRKKDIKNEFSTTVNELGLKKKRSIGFNNEELIPYDDDDGDY